MTGQQPPGWDLPFEEQPPADITDDFVLAGSITVMGATVPSPVLGKIPAVVFRFTGVDGRFLPPVLLLLDEERMRSVAPLVDAAVNASIRQART